MYFRVPELPLSAALLTQCAQLAVDAYGAQSSRVASIADARVYLLKHMTTSHAMVCLGLEGSEVRALTIGVVETRAWPAMFLLSVLAVSPDRQSKGFGHDLLDFAVRQAHARGADIAHIARPLEPRAESFLIGKGFRPDEDGVHLRYPLSEEASGIMSPEHAAMMYGSGDPG